MLTRARCLGVVLPALVLGLSGCIGDKAEYVHSVWRDTDATTVHPDIFYVTDRAPDRDWPGGFGKHWSGTPACGVAATSIPAAGLPGQPIPNGKLGATRMIACGGDDLTGIAAAIAAEARRKNCGEVLVYVHGFNTLFDGGLLRGAQMSNDTATGCVAAGFSWSSEGEVKRYVADIEHSAYAVPILESFLRALAAQDLRVDIVAHSIGPRIALASLAAMAAHGHRPRDNFVGEMVLAAADVGADPVNNDFLALLKASRPFVRRTTIYASAGDAALVISASAHGDIPRAGREPALDRAYQTRADERNGASHIVDVIDSSDAPAETLGHSYFALSYEAVSDIALALADVPVSTRLDAIAGHPPTLICKHYRTVTCDPVLPRYALNIGEGRKPSFLSRLVRRLAPIIPRLQMAPLDSAVQ